MKAERHNKKKEQGAETKKRLYESAERLFTQYNYNDVNVESITKAAGVTKGTFYVHFVSKEELYISIYTDYVSRVDTDYIAFLDNLPPDLSTSEVLLALTEKIANVLVDTIGYDKMKTLYTLQLTRAVNTEAVNGYNRKLYAIFDSLLQQGVQRGEFKASLPIETLTKHFLMAFRGLTYEWCIRHPDFNYKEQAVKHLELLLSGIKA